MRYTLSSLVLSRIARRWAVCLLVIAVLPASTICADTAAVAKRVDVLVRLLGSENFVEREESVKELIEIGAPALDALRHAAASMDPEIARRAASCIPDIKRNERAMALADGLRGKSAKERCGAADSLYEMGPGACKAIPALIAALNDEESEVRVRVVYALGAIGPAAEPALLSLIRLLKDKKAGDEVRWPVAMNLAKFGPNARQAVPVLLEILETEDALMKIGAIDALGNLGQDDPRVVPALIKALDHPHSSVHRGAAGALARLAREPDKAVSVLMRFIAKHKAEPELSDSRAYVIRLLGRFRSRAKPAVAMLVEIAKDEKEHSDVRENAVEALGRIGRDAREALPALRVIKEQERSPGSKLSLRILETISEIEPPQE